MMNYEFHVGDYVETTDGEVGYIVDICNCPDCEDRGFYEPLWRKFNSNDTDYITCHEYFNGFKGYKRIGKYDFMEQNKKIEKLADSGWNISVSGDDLISAINELVNAINELREKE